MSKLEEAIDKVAGVKSHMGETQIMVEEVQTLMDEALSMAESVGSESIVEQVQAVKSRLAELDAGLIEAGQHADDITVDLQGMVSG
jgi:predicted amino acid-binding ACT domain protein